KKNGSSDSKKNGSSDSKKNGSSDSKKNGSSDSNNSCEKKKSRLYHEVLNLHYIAELNYANLWQIMRYLQLYSTLFVIMHNTDYLLINKGWEEIKEKKSVFFSIYKEFIDDEILLKNHKNAYTEYIKKMREILNITNRYFYDIFTLKRPVFIILCIFMNIFYFIVFIIVYNYCKLNYYYQPFKHKPTILFITLTLFNVLILFDSLPKNIYIMLLSILFLFFLIRFNFLKNTYKFFYIFFAYFKLPLIFNSLGLGQLKDVNIRVHSKNDDNMQLKTYPNGFVLNKEGVIDDNGDTLHNRKYIDQIGSNRNGIKQSDNKQSDNKQSDNKQSDNKQSDNKQSDNKQSDNNRSYNKNSVYLSYLYNIKIFNILKKIFNDILYPHKCIILTIIWGFCAVSCNYIEFENQFIHFILIAYVICTNIRCRFYNSAQFYQKMLLLLFLTVNALMSFYPSYYEHDKEKLFFKKSVLKFVLPIFFYFFNILSLNSNKNKIIKNSVKKVLLTGWTLQFVLVFLFFMNTNNYYKSFIPPAIYVLTISLILWVLLKKSDSIIKTKEIEKESFRNLHEISMSFYFILLSLLQLSLIIYSNTNLSILLFFYPTLFLFYFYFINVNMTENEQTINNLKIKWIRENINIDMFNNLKQNKKESTTATITPATITATSDVTDQKKCIEKQIYLQLKQMKNIILNKIISLNEIDVMQIQVHDLIKNITFFTINETDFYLMSYLLLKYSFFLTGHKLLFISLPISSGFVGLNGYVWPLSQIYLSAHVFFPLIFSFFFVLYIFNLRRIKFIGAFNELDINNLYFQSLLNLLFKTLIIFSLRCSVTLWTTLYLSFHVMLYNFFIPNYFFLTLITIVYIILSLLVLLINKRKFLR
ncbi:GPI ethanolamine phosphate transferase 3, putative, partial [Hepatocystis sp. ex Piliocolobus tephrosceles]